MLAINYMFKHILLYTLYDRTSLLQKFVSILNS